MPDASTDSVDVRILTDRILDQAVQRKASDVHFEPEAGGLEVRWRIDGLLEPAGQYEQQVGQSLVARLMVLAELLTYRQDVPQEGRLRVLLPSMTRPIELRLAVMPTTHGLRAAVRLPAELVAPRTLDELALPAAVLAGLRRFATADAGLLLLIGPAGSGKTTTIYALLAEIVAASPGLCAVSLEDPVERDLAGITQIQVTPFGQLTYERALRSILRQDPQVLMLGEIRDAATASLAVQAALSGHRLISTLHAANPGGAIARLLEMGLEPYQISSALFAVVSQRLLRRRQDDGYRGRVPAAELVTLDPPLRAAILRRDDAQTIQRLAAEQSGYASLRRSAADLVRDGITDAAEVTRVLGNPAEGEKKI